MKKIGIIGGIGPESTIEYYRMLIKLFREKFESDHYPDILIQSIDMSQMLDYVFKNELDELVKFLRSKVEILEQSGVDYVALASNTPHLVFDQLADAVNTRMISIVEETCKSISKSGLKKVGLLGTKSTMSKGFYQSVAHKYGIEMLIPNKEDQNYIHEKYMGELVFNQINPETKIRLIDIVQNLQNKKQIQGIVLGGTELPLILHPEDFEKLRVFNTTEIHVNAILEKMMED